MSKRIAIFAVFEGEFTGGVRVALSLAIEMKALGHAAIIFTNVESPLTDECTNLGIEYLIVRPHRRIDKDDGESLRGNVFVRAMAALRLIQFNGTFRKCLKDLEIDIVWCRNIKTVLMVGLACRTLGVPMVWDIGMEKKSVGIVKRLHGIGFRLASKVVTEGKSVQTSTFSDSHRKKFAGKLMVIASGIPRERVKAIQLAQGSPKQNSGDVRLLSVATISDRKNQIMLLSAAKLIVSEFPQAKFVLVGPVVEPEYGERVERFIAENGLTHNVELLGWRKDVVNLLVGSDMFLLTSRIEGVPYSILEAMHAEIPVVATAAGGVPDVINSGVTGHVVPIDDVTGFADAVLTCLRDPQTARLMAANAKAIVEDEYSVGNWAQRYSELFIELTS